MRIAAIIPGYPEPADRGTYKRYRAMLTMLTDLGDVDCVCLVDDDRPLPSGGLRDRLHRLATPRVTFQSWRSLPLQMLDPLPANVRHWYDPAIQRQVNDFFAGHEYDLVLLGDLVSVPYAAVAGLTRYPCWLDRARVDVEFQRQKAIYSSVGWWRRLADRLRLWKTACFEREVTDMLAGEVVCSASDGEVLRRHIGHGVPIATVVNGIDTQAFPDQGPLTAKPTVMIPGAMDYLPNVDGVEWFLSSVWPLVRAVVPEAECLLVGREPIPEITAHHGRDGVIVTGQVESMLPWYRAARAVCAPIRIGGGSRLKVVEAWSVGRPLVATTTAVDGLDCSDQAAVVTDDPEGMAQNLIQVLVGAAAEPLRRGALRAAQRYTWSAVTTELRQRWAA